jgi:carbonic anhydrase
MSETLARGVARFRRGHFRRHRDRYAALARDGQSPHALFITCADSRILPHALTHTEAGELFVLRNVGNMVPPYDAQQPCAAVGSALEYAVELLGVEHIVVCGHSHCGACAALYDEAPAPDAGPSAIRQWLAQGERVKTLVLDKAAHGEGGLAAVMQSSERKAQLLRATERAMVVQHLANLLGYPGIAPRVEAGELELHGWYYRLESGEIERYDPQRLAFVPLAPAAAPPRLS